jgi:hypothetical protein
MQATDRLGAQCSEFAVPLRQHPQHRCFVLTPDFGEALSAQGGDRHGTGIIRIVLLGFARRQHPNP